MATSWACAISGAAASTRAWNLGNWWMLKTRDASMRARPAQVRPPAVHHGVEKHPHLREPSDRDPAFLNARAAPLAKERDFPRARPLGAREPDDVHARHGGREPRVVVLGRDHAVAGLELDGAILAHHRAAVRAVQLDGADKVQLAQAAPLHLAQRVTEGADRRVDCVQREWDTSR
jgi:hypothetical protein